MSALDERTAVLTPAREAGWQRDLRVIKVMVSIVAIIMLVGVVISLVVSVTVATELSKIESGTTQVVSNTCDPNAFTC